MTTPEKSRRPSIADDDDESTTGESVGRSPDVSRRRMDHRAKLTLDITTRFLKYYAETKGDKRRQLEAWTYFLSDLDRKVHVLKWLSPDDISISLNRMSDKEKRELAGIFEVLNEKLFPANFDEKLTYLRRVVGLAACAAQYRLERVVTGNPQNTPLILAGMGTTMEGMREYGFSVTEMLKAGYGPCALLKAHWTLMDLKKAGVTAMQLVDDQYPSTGENCRALYEAGYELSDVVSTGCFTAEQMQFAGYKRVDIEFTGMKFIPPLVAHRKKSIGSYM
mmetsp:Transcript_36853/g.44578  ORF Transcript_36853/g.44578 Transcript_36853/m.44578 type:complete len:278 (+) Transcript_36853:64-897(+)|eukprot:CAMPEP_0197867652 /NCGR_PEP_ID=MMETSP1438-20131217/44871_1 /TAXON_ID=1461541 /ORGANISM="Pterosperma sp., Strain CCMP1384" /LENGTH=277 /DNA_ID=CAMNT_0043486313 /DNA_START=40 /DNA_END=873 /DNA_ORIENTATION=-